MFYLLKDVGEEGPYRKCKRRRSKERQHPQVKRKENLRLGEAAGCGLFLLLRLYWMRSGVAPEEEFRRAIDSSSYERESVVGSLHDGLTKIENIPFGIFNCAPQMMSCDSSPHVKPTLLHGLNALFRTHVFEYLCDSGSQHIQPIKGAQSRPYYTQIWKIPMKIEQLWQKIRFGIHGITNSRGIWYAACKLPMQVQD